MNNASSKIIRSTAARKRRRPRVVKLSYEIEMAVSRMYRTVIRKKIISHF